MERRTERVQKKQASYRIRDFGEQDYWGIYNPPLLDGRERMCLRLRGGDQEETFSVSGELKD
jgi:hypothetical protein